MLEEVSPLRVSTQWEARLVGWLVVVPFAGFFWLLGLGAVILSIWAWIGWWKGTLMEISVLVVVSLLPILGFAIVYFASGWVHDFLATYELARDGLTKRSPFWKQKVLWQQVTEWRATEDESVWWLLNERQWRIMRIDWHMLPPEPAAMMKAALLRHLKPRWEAILAKWATQGASFRPSVGAVLVSGLKTALLISGAFRLWWDGLNTLWDYVLFPLALAATLLEGWKTLRLATKKVQVRGDWLVVSELFKSTRMHLGTVTHVTPTLSSSLWSKRMSLSGIELVGGVVRVRLTQESQGFFMLLLYITQRLPTPWKEMVRAMAIGEMK